MRLYDYAASGNCYTVRLLLALLARHYERVEIYIFVGQTLTAVYAAINSVRETPVLELDGLNRGLIFTSTRRWASLRRQQQPPPTLLQHPAKGDCERTRIRRSWRYIADRPLACAPPLSSGWLELLPRVGGQ